MSAHVLLWQEVNDADGRMGHVVVPVSGSHAGRWGALWVAGERAEGKVGSSRCLRVYLRLAGVGVSGSNPAKNQLAGHNMALNSLTPPP